MTIFDINTSYKGVSAIYMIENRINHKKYIGQIVDMYSRFLEYRKLRFDVYLDASVNKYGIENFEVSMLEKDIQDKDLRDREKYWMEFYKTLDPQYGYNLQDVDTEREKYRWPKELREEMSRKAKGKKKRVPSWNKGKELPKLQTLKRLATAQGIYIDDVVVASWSRSLPKRYLIYPICQIDKNSNEVIKVWNNIRDACDYLGANPNSIYKCLLKIRITSFGYRWEWFVSDVKR